MKVIAHGSLNLPRGCTVKARPLAGAAADALAAALLPLAEVSTPALQPPKARAETRGMSSRIEFSVGIAGQRTVEAKQSFAQEERARRCKELSK
jgi:hypothetical protein